MNYNLFLMGLTLLGCAPTGQVLADKNTEITSNETKRHSSKQGYLKWLYCAETDLKAAKKLAESHELAGPMVYHIQQCVEKALKAYLVYHHLPVARTHNLTELLKSCSRVDKEFASLHNAAAELSPYATITRYPNNSSLPNTARIENAMSQALKILSLVKNKMDLCTTN